MQRYTCERKNHIVLKSYNQLIGIMVPIRIWTWCITFAEAIRTVKKQPSPPTINLDFIYKNCMFQRNNIIPRLIKWGNLHHNSKRLNQLTFTLIFLPKNSPVFVFDPIIFSSWLFLWHTNPRISMVKLAVKKSSRL